jgi:hypothetical protein
MPIRGWIQGWLLVMILFIFPQTADAREKTDLLVLKNGNQITCAVVSLARGMLTAKTDSMGTVEIKWQDITQMTSKFLFLVQNSRGELFVGSVEPGPAEGKMKIVGPEPVDSLDHNSVVDIREYYGSRWRRFSGAIDLSYNYSKASDRTQFNFSGDLAYTTERITGTLDYSTDIGTSNGNKDSDRDVIAIGGSLKLGQKWYGYSQGKYEHNLELQLNRRTSILGGPAYALRRTNRAQVTMGGGAAYSRESYYGQEIINNAEGVFLVDAEFFKLYSPKIDISAQYELLPSMTTGGRIRSEISSKLRFELLKDFYLTFTFYNSYDSKPPSENSTKNDYGFTTGISWTFRR